MKEAIELNISGIKCDNPNCDFIDEHVKVSDYKQWLNKPCPKCGENLLTQTDFDNVKMIISATNIMNNILPKIKRNQSTIETKIEMNGTGNMNFKEV